jgi:hypothetical protein
MDDVLFYIDNKGEDEDADEDTKNLTENGGRKRKEGRSAEQKKIKFVKYDLCQNSDSARARPSFFSNDGGFSSESEVENPHSDEDTETKE